MIWTLYKIELFKMFKRLAFWVAMISFPTLSLLPYGYMFYDDITSTREYKFFSFPDAWRMVLSDGAELVCIFSAVLVSMLIASEFDWRTSRQNIIDGLSKRQWMSVKLMVVPTIVILGYSTRIIVLGALAWLGTRTNIEHANELLNVQFTGMPGYLITRPITENVYKVSNVQIFAFAGVILAGLLAGSLSLLVSLITRSAGPAMGIMAIYMPLEIAIFRTLNGLGWNTAANVLPFRVVSALCNYNQYMPSGSHARDQLEFNWHIHVLFTTGCGWVLVLVAAAWLVYRLRDL